MSLVRLFYSLRFRITAIAALAAVVAAIVTAGTVLHVVQSDAQQALLDSESQDRERLAALLSSKLETLKTSLALSRPQAYRAMKQGKAASATYLLSQVSLGALFDSIFIATSDGSLLAHVDDGVVGEKYPNIADRAYFQQAMKTDQAVVSEPILGKLTGIPMIVVATPILDAKGRTTGVLGGLLRLRSNSLFTDLLADRRDGIRDMVMDRNGVFLSHTQAASVFKNARHEPGLARAFERWHDMGSPIDTTASSTLSEGHVVSIAGIPLSEWTLVRLTPRSRAFAAMESARHSAQVTALATGLISAALAGVLAWLSVRPIVRLGQRADRMSAAGDLSTTGWPKDRGEIGQLSEAFQRLLLEADRRQGDMHDLVRQMRAVLDNAEVGIVLTRNGHFETISEQFLSIFQYARGDLEGRPSSAIYPSLQAYEELSQRAQPDFLEKGMFDGEVELMRSNGEIFWAHMRGRAIVPGDRSHGTIWVVTDVTHAHRQRETLTWAAGHDSLTKLPNRATFEQLLETAVARSRTQPFCVLAIDLDRFKYVNDSGGHAAGDALLKGIAQIFAASLRQTDTVARIGGDEFAVLLPNCPPSRASAIAQQLCSAVDSYFLEWEGRSYSVGASIGVIWVNGEHQTGAEVMRLADAACYQAKDQGRNRVALAA